MGKYVYVNGTNRTNRECNECQNGRFGTNINIEACSPWRNCESGSMVSRHGNRTVNRECQICPAGRYDTRINADECENEWNDCIPGSFVSANGSNTHNRSCLGCEYGKYTASSNEQSCATWHACDYYGDATIDTYGTSTSDNACAQKVCPGGQFGRAVTFSCSELPVDGQRACYSFDGFNHITKTWTSVGGANFVAAGSGNVYGSTDEPGTR